MLIPKEWNWFKLDKRNIRALAHIHGVKRMDTFPALGTAGVIWHHFVRGIRWVSFLDYLPFNKFTALDALEARSAYKRYPYKHYESVFTRFYQGYILPRKFGVDKRKLHLSTLVASGQITRDQALKCLEGIPYPSEADMQADVTYFLKKMRWTLQQLEDYMARSEISHASYPTERPRWEFFKGVYKRFIK